MKIGLALGGGGANGLAHIPMLEVLDDLGVRPHHVCGTSIGAVIGALYAAGMSGREIRSLAASLVIRDTDTWRDIFGKKRLAGWTELLDPGFGAGGLVSGKDFLDFLYESIDAKRFEQLTVPLSVVATDFWRRAQLVFDHGEFRPAVEASMALPGLFAPVSVDGRLLVDGGAVNPVPFDVLPAECDLTVAIDVTGQRSPTHALSTFDVVFNTFQIMQQSIVAGKRERSEPDIFVDPSIRDIRALEFYRFDEVMEQARPAAGRLKRQLAERLGRS